MARTKNAKVKFMSNEKVEKSVELGKKAEMVVFSVEPYNAGPPIEKMAENFITDIELFYVRNHGTIPEIAAQDFTLEVGGMVEKKLALSLAEVKKRFKSYSITATMQCAGNRRQEMIDVREVPGETPWTGNAISCAKWRGVRLADVLSVAGIKTGARHVWFDGADDVAKIQSNFGGSIPLEKALADEVLLAFEMNGKPLTPTHGAPLRAVVPGYIGARSVKWLTKITVQKTPSTNHYQQTAYKIFPPHVDKNSVDWTKGLMLSEGQINSLICSPQENETLSKGATTIRGYATTGGGRSIERVEISTDGGKHWTEAELLEPRQKAETESNVKSWAWQFWECKVNLKSGAQEICVRAFDSSANTQPETIAPLWNFKGYMTNGWHRVKVKVKK